MLPARSDISREGSIVRLDFPAALSAASYEDFEAWVELVLRRAKRGVSKEDEAALVGGLALNTTSIPLCTSWFRHPTSSP